LYVLRFTSAGLADVKSLPKNVRNTLQRELLSKVAKDPEGCSQGLRGELEGFRSFQRMMKSGKPHCTCRLDPAKRHGPYFEWTYKARERRSTSSFVPNRRPSTGPPRSSTGN